MASEGSLRLTAGSIDNSRYIAAPTLRLSTLNTCARYIVKLSCAAVSSRPEQGRLTDVSSVRSGAPLRRSLRLSARRCRLPISARLNGPLQQRGDHPPGPTTRLRARHEQVPLSPVVALDGPRFTCHVSALPAPELQQPDLDYALACILVQLDFCFEEVSA